MIRTLNNKFFRAITSFITLLAVFFVFQRISTNQIWKASSIEEINFLSMIGIGSIVYFLNTILQPITWKYVLSLFGEKSIQFIKVYTIYGKTQIAKYIPGNIFHLANRHVISLHEGSKNIILLGAATFELIGYLSISAFICLLGYFLGASYINLPFYRIILILLITSGLFIVFYLLLPKLSKYIHGLEEIENFIKQITSNTSVLHVFPKLIPSLGTILLFFTIASTIFIYLILEINHGSLDFIPIPLVFSIFSISYLVGLITPGAPAGIGVRETSMILLLTPYLGEGKATLVALSTRLVTTIGDFLFFIVASLIDCCLLNHKDHIQ